MVPPARGWAGRARRGPGPAGGKFQDAESSRGIVRVGGGSPDLFLLLWTFRFSVQTTNGAHRKLIIGGQMLLPSSPQPNIWESP